VWLISTDDSSPRRLKAASTSISGAAFSADGRFAASGGIEGGADGRTRVIWVWDLETGEERVAGAITDRTISSCEILFAPGGEILYATTGGRSYAIDLTSGSLKELGWGSDSMAISPDGRTIFLAGNIDVPILGPATEDLKDGDRTSLVPLADTNSVALDREGKAIVTGSIDGSIRVGQIGGGEPHVLLGHNQEPIVSISPDGRWIASTSSDGSIRLWPMPDLSKPPLHTLPHDELIAKLKTLTNLRVIRDEDSPTGWKVDIGPFPGWETVPEW
jgi:WD40 repeat protein